MSSQSSRFNHIPLACQHTLTTSFSGDRPLGEALELMNKEGITSLAVVDNQYNVVGNISTVDVKVRTATCSSLCSYHSSRRTASAPHQVKPSSPAEVFLHPLHIRYLIDSGHGRRQRLFPSVSCKSLLNARTHCGKTCRNKVT